VLGGWFDGHILADWRWRLETFCGIVNGMWNCVTAFDEWIGGDKT